MFFSYFFLLYQAIVPNDEGALRKECGSVRGRGRRGSRGRGRGFTRSFYSRGFGRRGRSNASSDQEVNSGEGQDTKPTNVAA